MVFTQDWITTKTVFRLLQYVLDMHDIEEELRWTKEALALVENHGHYGGDVDMHKLTFPMQYSRLLDKDEDWLRDHKERLERDIKSREDLFLGEED